jgi:hypothetical protein
MTKNRPRDLNVLAKSIVDLAAGIVHEATEPAKKDSAAVALGRKGGTARAKSMTAEQRVNIARKAAAKRWKKKD